MKWNEQTKENEGTKGSELKKNGLKGKQWMYSVLRQKMVIKKKAVSQQPRSAIEWNQLC